MSWPVRRWNSRNTESTPKTRCVADRNVKKHQPEGFAESELSDLCWQSGKKGSIIKWGKRNTSRNTKDLPLSPRRLTVALSRAALASSFRRPLLLCCHQPSMHGTRIVLLLHRYSRYPSHLASLVVRSLAANLRVGLRSLFYGRPDLLVLYPCPPQLFILATTPHH